jgi:hypothetical protein
MALFFAPGLPRGCAPRNDAAPLLGLMSGRAAAGHFQGISFTAMRPPGRNRRTLSLRLAGLGRAPWTARGVLRGGSSCRRHASSVTNNNPQNLRAAYRNNNNPQNRNNNIGFRVALGWQYDFRRNFQGHGSGERAFFVQGRTRRSWHLITRSVNRF